MIPFTLFRPGLKPSEADVQAILPANRARYMVPEQRVVRFARIGAEQVAGIAASDKEIADYYNAHPALMRRARAAPSARPSSPTATAKRSRPAPKAGRRSPRRPRRAATTSRSPRSPERESYASSRRRQGGGRGIRGSRRERLSARSSPSSVGSSPRSIRSRRKAVSRSAAAQAEIAAKITAAKRKDAIEDLVEKVQDTIDSGGSFARPRRGKAAGDRHPAGDGQRQIAHGCRLRLPADLMPALKTGFEVAPNEQPEVVSLEEGEAYAVVAPAEVVAAAPAPLASIRDRVAATGFSSRRSSAPAPPPMRSRPRPRAPAAWPMRSGSRGRPSRSSRSPPGGSRSRGERTGPARVSGPVHARRGQGDGRPDPEGRGFFVVKVDQDHPRQCDDPAASDRPGAKRTSEGRPGRLCGPVHGRDPRGFQGPPQRPAIAALKQRICGGGEQTLRLLSLDEAADVA